MELFDSVAMRDRIALVKSKISELASDPTKNESKELYLMGLITPILDELGADPAIIVGGQAVELYTSGSYKTVDVEATFPHKSQGIE